MFCHLSSITLIFFKQTSTLDFPIAFQCNILLFLVDAVLLVVIPCGLTCQQTPTFWRKIMHSSSEVKMEVVCSSGILVSTFKSTRCFYQKNIEIFTAVRSWKIFSVPCSAENLGATVDQPTKSTVMRKVVSLLRCTFVFLLSLNLCCLELYTQD